MKKAALVLLIIFAILSITTVPSIAETTQPPDPQSVPGFCRSWHLAGIETHGVYYSRLDLDTEATMTINEDGTAVITSVLWGQDYDTVASGLWEQDGDDILFNFDGEDQFGRKWAFPFADMAYGYWSEDDGYLITTLRNELLYFCADEPDDGMFAFPQPLKADTIDPFVGNWNRKAIVFGNQSLPVEIEEDASQTLTITSNGMLSFDEENGIDNYDGFFGDGMIMFEDPGVPIYIKVLYNEDGTITVDYSDYYRELGIDWMLDYMVIYEKIQ